MPVRIVAFPFGSAGDVHPLIGLCLALHARGHEITFAVNGHFLPLVRRSFGERPGLEILELGAEAEYLESAAHPDLWNPSRSFAHLFKNGVLKILPRQYELVAEQAARGPTIVLANCFGFGARVASEKFGVPLLTVHLQPSCMWSEHETPVLSGLPTGPRTPRFIKRALIWAAVRFVMDPIACPELNRFRASVGLAPMKNVFAWWHSPDGVLGLFPEWYAAPQPDWPPHTVVSQFPLWDEAAVTAPQPEVEAFLAAGSPPLVFTPGSGHRLAGAFFQKGIEICTRLDRRGMFLTRFAEQIPANLPASIRHFPFIPLGRLLPRSAAIIHHGGIGTMSQAMQAGIPQLIIPLAHDQPDNAARVTRLSVGAGLDPRRFTAAQAAAQLQTLLTSPQIQAACARVAARFVGVSPFDEACAAIEGLARKRYGDGVRQGAG